VLNTKVSAYQLIKRVLLQSWNMIQDDCPRFFRARKHKAKKRARQCEKQTNPKKTPRVRMKTARICVFPLFAA
jgi:hypothetical protein